MRTAGSRWQICQNYPVLCLYLLWADFWRLRHVEEAAEFIGITFPPLLCGHNPAGFIILWPWAHTGSICGQACSRVFIHNRMDRQVRVRGNLGAASWRLWRKCLERKTEQNGWCPQQSWICVQLEDKVLSLLVNLCWQDKAFIVSAGCFAWVELVCSTWRLDSA